LENKVKYGSGFIRIRKEVADYPTMKLDLNSLTKKNSTLMTLIKHLPAGRQGFSLFSLF